MDTIFNNLISNEIFEITECTNTNDFFHSIPNSNPNFLCIHINIRSIIKNFESLEQCIANSIRLIDVIVLSEVNISDNISCLYQLHGYQMFTKLRQSRKGGGIIIYVHNSHTCKVKKVNTHYCESILCTVITKSSYTANLCAIYRPPNYNKNLFIDELHTTLSPLNIATDLYLIGDINIDLKQDTPSKHKYTNTLHSLGLMCGITDYTRIELSNGRLNKSCIDHIFARSRSQDLFTAALGTTLADHRAVIIACVGAQVQEVPRYKSCVDNNKLCKLLDEIDWKECCKIKCPNLIYNNIQKNFKKCYENSKHTIKIKNASKHSNSWINYSVIKSCLYRDQLYNKWKKDTNNFILKREYNKARNLANKLILKTKNQHLKSEINFNKNNPRHLWQILNRITGKIKHSVDDVILSAFNEQNLTNKTIANNFSNTFVTSVQEITSKCSVRLLDRDTYSKPQNVTMRFRPAKPRDIGNIINSLNHKKAPGIDGIRTIDVKRISAKISVCLANLINQSVISGKYPNTLKTGIVRPIVKKGSRCNYNNYRPITILPVINKIAEKYITKEIHEFYKKINHLTEKQYGFQPKKNTTQLLSSFTDQIYEHLDEKRHVMVVFIDYSKAFDTLRHDILLEKLQHSGIKGNLLNWCGDYLKDRKFCVRINEAYSDPIQMKQGTAQGSVLGPLHYLTYVNSLPDLIKNCDIYQFADDTCLLAAANAANEALDKLQSNLDILVKWSHDMGLVINSKKTKMMYISTSHNRSCFEPRLILHNHDCLHKNCSGNMSTTCHCDNIEVVEKQTYLGLVIDHHINWKHHINHVCDKLRIMLAKFSLIKGKIPFTTLLLLYISLAESTIAYGLSSYGRTYKSHLDKIYSLQLRLLKKIVPEKIKYKFKSDYTKLFKFCKILPLQEKVYKTLLVEYFFDEKLRTQKNYATNQLLTRNMIKPKLYLPNYNNQYGKRRLNYTIPQLINQLPEDIKETLTSENIKYKLRQYFIDLL